MDKKLKAKWVAALRSGEYRQCRNVLKDDDGRYCCLGILAELCGADLDIETKTQRETSYHPSFKGQHGDDSWPRTLADMNDDHGKTFTEIADYIEATL